MEEGDIIARYGLIARSADLPEIRARLVEATEHNNVEGVLRELCVLLFAVGDPRDTLLIWKAKMSSFDTSCSVEVQLLCGAGLETTTAFLHDSSEAAAEDALEYIEECIAAGDFEGFSPKAQLEFYRHYYDLP